MFSYKQVMGTFMIIFTTKYKKFKSLLASNVLKDEGNGNSQGRPKTQISLFCTYDGFGSTSSVLQQYISWANKVTKRNNQCFL